MKKYIKPIFIFSIIYLALISTSCFGAFLEKSHSNSSGTATVIVRAGNVVDEANPVQADKSLNARVIAPQSLLTAGSWDRLEVIIEEEDGTPVDTKTITPEESAEFSGLISGKLYTFKIRLELNSMDIANGSMSKRLDPGPNTINVPVSRTRTEIGRGSFTLSIQMNDFSHIESMNAKLYKLPPIGSESDNPIEIEHDEVNLPWVWNIETGLFTINWPDLPSDTYLLSVFANVQNVLGSVTLGHDAFVEIFDGCISSTEPKNAGGLDFLDSALRYYVSSEGSMGETGHLPNKPTTFENALVAANINTLATELRPARIILLNNVNLANEQTITSPLHISGLTGAESISPSNSLEMYLLQVGEPEAPASLTLKNVTISAGDPESQFNAPSGLIVVTNGNLVLDTGSVVSGNFGGGVAMPETATPSTIHLRGGSITYCSTNGTEDGGGIYATTGTVYLDSGTISNCSARYGGGLWVGANATVVRDGSGTLTFSNNTAGIAGGAIGFASSATDIPIGLEIFCDDTNTATIAFPKLARSYAGYNETAIQEAIENSAVVPSFITIADTLNFATVKSIPSSGSVFLYGLNPATITRAAGFNDNTATFSVGSGASLIFSNVTLNAETSVPHSYIEVYASATCSLLNNSKITGLNAGSSNVSGLAVTLTAGATLTIDNSQITNCSSVNGRGGAVYIDPTSLLILSGSATELSGNSAPEGGAIYSEAPVDFKTSLTTGCIHDNTATENAGGLYDAQTTHSVMIDGVSADKLDALKYFANNTSSGSTGSFKTVNWGHIVSFNVKSDMVFESDPSLTQLVADTYPATKPSDPAAPLGKEFDGWYQDNQFSYPWIFEDYIMQDTTLYGQMRLPSITVTFTINEQTPEILNITGSTTHEIGFTNTVLLNGPEGFETYLWTLNGESIGSEKDCTVNLATFTGTLNPGENEIVLMAFDANDTVSVGTYVFTLLP